MLIFIHLALAGLFVILGILFSLGKGAWLIAGYNTSPPVAKARYDEKALCKFMGKFMFTLAACWLPLLLSTLLDSMALLWAGLILFCIVILAGVIYANTGNRFMK